MSTIIDLSRSSPAEDDSRTSLQQRPPRPVRINPYASEIIPLSDSDDSDPDILLQEMQNAGRPKRVLLQSRAEGPVAGPSRFATGEAASSTRHSDAGSLRRDPALSGMENVSPVNVSPYAKGQSFQKLKEHQADTHSRAPSVPPDIIQVSHASVAGVQPRERILDSDKVAPSPHLNPMDRIVAQVLEIIPDVSPPHAHSLVQKYYPDYQSTTHEMVVHALLEDPNYPKCERGKRKRGTDDQGGQGKGKAKEPKIDYLSKDRPYTGGHAYMSLAMMHLQDDYPLIPIPHIRRVLLSSNGLYVPAFHQLRADCVMDHPPFKRKAQASHVTKHKGPELYDEAFETEKIWLARRLQEESEEADERFAAQIEEEELEKSGMGIECGCCFVEHAFDHMVQCPDAHLFCKTCARRSAEEAIGNRKAELLCMDQSGCKEHFHQSQIERYLPPKTMALWERIKQEKAINQAQIEGLESCPFCSYSVVIENEQERLFRCESEECGIVSCRACKKEDHLPKTCKEMEADTKLDAKHYVEEAMTAALTRRCPNCKHPFIKTEGCNKMVCPSCYTMSCYVCRQIIAGYDHFNASNPHTGARDPTKCILWDTGESRTNDEVAVAARNALQKYKLEHPDEVSGTLEIDFPELLGPPTSRRAANASRARPPIPPPLQPLPPLNLGGIANYPNAPYNYHPLAIQHYPAAPVLPVRAHDPQVAWPRRRRR